MVKPNGKTKWQIQISKPNGKTKWLKLNGKTK